MSVDLDRGSGWGGSVAENTQTLSAAVNLPAYSGARIQIPAGTFKFSNPIWIAPSDGPTSPTIQGEGRNATVLVPTNPDEPAFQIGGGVGRPPVRQAKISDLQIMYDTPPAPGVPMIVLRNVKGFMMRDVWLRQYRTAMLIGSNADGLEASCEDIHVDNVKMDPAPETFHEGQGVGGGVICIENVNGLWVRGCSISGVGSQIGLMFTCAGTTTVDTMTVSDTLIKDCLSGVRAGGGTASNVLFSSVYFDKCASVGLHLETAPDRELRNWSFDGCWVHSAKYGYIVDGRQGAITRCRVTGGMIDAAPVPFAVHGPVDFARFGI